MHLSKPILLQYTRNSHLFCVKHVNVCSVNDTLLFLLTGSKLIVWLTIYLLSWHVLAFCDIPQVKGIERNHREEDEEIDEQAHRSPASRVVASFFLH